MWPSVRVHVTGVGPLRLRFLVRPEEVSVSRCTAEPGLAEAQRASEEEFALARFHTALMRHQEFPHPDLHPCAALHEHLTLLPVHVGQSDVH